MMGQIGVIGIGRLGLCVSLILECFGYNVIGIDIDEVYVKSLNQKTFHTMEPLVTDYLRKSVNFVATTGANVSTVEVSHLLSNFLVNISVSPQPSPKAVFQFPP